MKIAKFDSYFCHKTHSMVRKLLVLVACCLFCVSGIALGRDGGKKKVSFEYEADFELYFDNREYNQFSPYPSKTIFGASVAPRIGFSVNGKHRVMAGMELQKQFGGEFSDILDGISLYYNYAGDKHRFYAGVIPREKMSGEYSRAFFSDSLNFFNQVLQGILYNYDDVTRSGWSVKVEAGIDWMGQYSDSARERFMIFSAGEFSKGIFKIGYNGYMYHFACSEAVQGVMDNILIYPYLKADFGSMAGIQELSVRAGWMRGSWKKAPIRVRPNAWPAYGGPPCTRTCRISGVRNNACVRHAFRHGSRCRAEKTVFLLFRGACGTERHDGTEALLSFASAQGEDGKLPGCGGRRCPLGKDAERERHPGETRARVWK